MEVRGSIARLKKMSHSIDRNKRDVKKKPANEQSIVFLINGNILEAENIEQFFFFLNLGH